VAVEEERGWWRRSEEEVSVEVKNWKSLRRRSAHLLAEQVIVVLTFEGFLKGGNSLGVQRPMPTCLKASIASLFCFVCLKPQTIVLLLRFSVSSLSSLASDNAEDKIQWAVFKKGEQRKNLFEYKPVDKKAGKVEEPKKLKENLKSQLLCHLHPQCFQFDIFSYVR